MNFKKIQQSSVTLMLVITVSKLVGILRDIVLANYYGTSNLSDAYLIASSIPTVLFYFIGNALATAYIPMFTKVKEKDGPIKAQRYSNNILTLSFLIATLMVLFLMIFPNIAVKLFASGFDLETANIACRLIRISVGSIYFMIVISIFTGYLQSYKSFLVPAAISLPRNFALIVSVIISFYFGIDYLGWGLLAAYILEVLFLLPFVLRKGYRYVPTLDLKEENLSQTMSMVLPILLSTFVARINGIIDKSIASNITEGAVSALSYSSIINTGINEVLVTGIITIMFVDCASLVAKEKYDEVKLKVSSTIKSLIFVLIPATVGVIILAKPIVSLILYRGNFDSTSLDLTSNCLVFYILGIVFVAVNSVIVKVFYSFKDTKTTTIVSTISIVLNICLNFLLSNFMGVSGLALSTTISSMFSTICLVLLLKRKIGDYGLKSIFFGSIKTLIASIIMAIFVNVIYRAVYGSISHLLALLLSIIAGMIVYFISSLLLRKDIITDLLKSVRKNNG